MNQQSKMTIGKKKKISTPKKRRKKRPEVIIKTDLSFDEILERAVQFDEKLRRKKTK